ncbi:MAG: PqqD family protein [Candidatus Omnitrophota bacterium]
MLTVDSQVCKKKHIPWRLIEGEAVLVDVDKGDVIYLDEAGAEIWKVIDQKNNEKLLIKEIISHICAQFEVEQTVAEADVLEFLNELAQKEVISD